MWKWFTSKNKPQESGATKAPEKPTRANLVANAIKNLRSTRSQIGEEKLQKLATMILEKKTVPDDVSPAEQAKKIIAQMDKHKADQLMHLMVQDTQTKH